MREFRYERPTTVAEAIRAVADDPEADFLAGGTTEVDLMKDGVFHPDLLVDITRLPLRGVRRNGTMLQVGALTTMEELAADPTIMDRAPLRQEALLPRGLDAVAQHGDHRRQPAPAHPLPLLPRPGRGGLQQAGARERLRGGQQRGPDARHPRGQPRLHRAARLRPGRGAGGARTRWCTCRASRRSGRCR